MEVERENLRERLESIYKEWNNINEHNKNLKIIIFQDISTALMNTNLMTAMFIAQERMLGSLDGLSSFLGVDVVKKVSEAIESGKTTENDLKRILFETVSNAAIEKVESRKDVYSKYMLYKFIEGKKLAIAARDIKKEYEKATLDFYINILIPLATIDLLREIEENRYEPFTIDLKMKIKDLPVTFLAMIEQSSMDNIDMKYYINVEKFSNDINKIYSKVREEYDMAFLPPTFEDYTREVFPVNVAKELILKLQLYADKKLYDDSLGVVFAETILESLKDAIEAVRKSDNAMVDTISQYLDEMRKDNYVGMHVVGVAKNMLIELRTLKENDNIGYL